MKRKITILSIFMIAMLLFTGNVFAAETFTHEGSTYVIDEVKLKLDSLGDAIDCLGMDENNNYVILDINEDKLYKVNENECILMSNQEILDFINTQYEIFNHIGGELEIFQDKENKGAYFEYIVTEDEVVDSNKEYYERIKYEEDDEIRYSYEIVENPDLVNGTYLELVFLVFPKNATIDQNIAYYKKNEGIYTKVENPKAEEILEYKIIADSKNYDNITKIGQLSQEVYDKIFAETNYSYDIHYDEVNKEVYILISYDDTKKSIIYKADGTIVAEYDELMLMEPLGNNFFIVAKCNEYYKRIDNKITIIDNTGKTIYESETIPYLETFGYEKYTTYLSYSTIKFYNMYEYELLSQDNQKYEGKDLSVKTSGELDRLTSVKVNGEELATSNYTKTSGSTIITLKNDYLKTLAIGTYTLELGYVDGTKIETKFVVDKLYNNDEGNGESSEGEVGGGAAGEAAQKPEKDDTPETGNNLKAERVMYTAILLITIVGVSVVAKLKK